MKAKKQRLGFDLDGIFIAPPLLIPKSLIEKLYKKQSVNLSYRIPGDFERKIRVASHYHTLRPAIRKNVAAVRKIFDDDKFSLFLISSRFSFLDKRTDEWLRAHKIKNYFEKMYFNINDKQPHIFKNEMIKKEGIEVYVDDDYDLLNYLSKENPKVEFYWISKRGAMGKLPSNIHVIQDLEEFRKEI